MAKPKGSTLTKLFEVSDAERQAFFDRIQHRGIVSVPHTEVIPTIESASTAIQTPNTDSVSHTETHASTIQIPPTDSYASTNKVSPFEPIPHTDIVRKRGQPKLRPARLAQDGHSHAEQAVYAALWEAGTPDPADGNRIVTMGLGRLSRFARLSENNCRLNIRNLVEKLALEEIKPEISAAGIGKTYRVYSYSAILQRRKTAGMEWVIRTKGVVFVHPNTVGGIVSVPHTDSIAHSELMWRSDKRSPVEPVGDAPIEAKGDAPTETAPQIRNSFRNSFQETSSSDLCSVVAQALRQIVTIDDDAIRQLVEGCRQTDPAASAAEIIYFARIKAAQHRNMRSIRNAVGLLIQAVPKCFEGSLVADYRAHLSQYTEQGREAARNILDDPNASEEDRDLAKSILS